MNDFNIKVDIKNEKVEIDTGLVFFETSISDARDLAKKLNEKITEAALEELTRHEDYFGGL